jgi:predicted enzyme related to lactoylglutathione lyase
MYTTLMTVPVDEKTRIPMEPGAINGGMMQRSKDTPATVVTVGVDAIDDTLKKIEAGGGSVVQPRTEIPNMGAFAYFKDSEGNVVGLWETL